MVTDCVSRSGAPHAGVKRLLLAGLLTLALAGLLDAAAAPAWALTFFTAAIVPFGLAHLAQRRGRRTQRRFRGP